MVNEGSQKSIQNSENPLSCKQKEHLRGRSELPNKQGVDYSKPFFFNEGSS
jgi:hypothetical protein